jgi:F-type H+-transporting ATPase subunit delta
MSDQSVARQYANALFDVAAKSRRIDVARRDLSAVVALVDEHADLSAVFAAPLIVPRKKRAVVEALLAQIGDLADEVRRLLLFLADRDRLRLLAAIRDAFEARVMDAAKVVFADVVTAVPLPAADEAALATALGKVTGRQVTIQPRVDPSIVGGVVARVGSLVIDGSVVRQMARLRERLLGEA